MSMIVQFTKNAFDLVPQGGTWVLVTTPGPSTPGYFALSNAGLLSAQAAPPVPGSVLTLIGVPVAAPYAAIRVELLLGGTVGQGAQWLAMAGSPAADQGLATSLTIPTLGGGGGPIYAPGAILSETPPQILRDFAGVPVDPASFASDAMLRAYPGNPFGLVAAPPPPPTPAQPIGQAPPLAAFFIATESQPQSPAGPWVFQLSTP